MKPIVTVVVLTLQSSLTIENVLDAVTRQKHDAFEILLVDSGSTDGTLEIAKRYPCRVVSIDPRDFGHGRTRNLAATLANGDFVAFLTHDSVPQHDTWLSEMLRPLADPIVAGVYGRQVPRVEENYLDRSFQATLYGTEAVEWNADNWEQGDNLFSDANSVVRKSVVLSNPYDPDIIVSEDYEWASRVLRLGYRIVYNPGSSVLHSHSYNFRELFRRNFDVGVSYRSIYETRGTGYLFANGVSIMWRELQHIYESGHAALIPVAVVRDVVRFVAIEMGKHEELFPWRWKRDHLSGQRWYWK